MKSYINKKKEAKGKVRNSQQQSQNIINNNIVKTQKKHPLNSYLHLRPQCFAVDQDSKQKNSSGPFGISPTTDLQRSKSNPQIKRISLLPLHFSS